MLKNEIQIEEGGGEGGPKPANITIFFTWEPSHLVLKSILILQNLTVQDHRGTWKLSYMIFHSWHHTSAVFFLDVTTFLTGTCETWWHVCVPAYHFGCIKNFENLAFVGGPSSFTVLEGSWWYSLTELCRGALTLLRAKSSSVGGEERENYCSVLPSTKKKKKAYTIVRAQGPLQPCLQKGRFKFTQHFFGDVTYVDLNCGCTKQFPVYTSPPRFMES